MDEQKRDKTLGQLVLERRDIGLEDDVREYVNKMGPDIMKRAWYKIRNAQATTAFANKDFYVAIHFTLDKMTLMPTDWIFIRHSCPTPVFKMFCFKFRHLSGQLEFLFNLPDRVLYNYIVENATRFLEDPETRQLAQFVMLDHKGELLKWVKKENGEKKDAIIKIRKEANA